MRISDWSSDVCSSDLFQNQKRRVGFVVDEYGDIQGLVTLEDILEEVVGEFTSDPATRIKNVYADADGSYRVSGSVTIRSLNRNLNWRLPTKGPKTINGLVLEQLEALPQTGAHVAIGGYTPIGSASCRERVCQYV